MYECHPQLCQAGDKCQNQRFQRRVYPKSEIFKTQFGWGLKTLESIKKVRQLLLILAKWSPKGVATMEKGMKKEPVRDSEIWPIMAYSHWPEPRPGQGPETNALYETAYKLSHWTWTRTGSKTYFNHCSPSLFSCIAPDSAQCENTTRTMWLT